MDSHTAKSPAKSTALPQYVSLARFDLCQHCGIISRPKVYVLTNPAGRFEAHTRQMLAARPTIARFFAQGSDRVTIVICDDCNGIRGIVTGRAMG